MPPGDIPPEPDHRCEFQDPLFAPRIRHLSDERQRARRWRPWYGNAGLAAGLGFFCCVTHAFPDRKTLHGMMALAIVILIAGVARFVVTDRRRADGTVLEKAGVRCPACGVVPRGEELYDWVALKCCQACGGSTEKEVAALPLAAGRHMPEDPS